MDVNALADTSKWEGTLDTAVEIGIEYGLGLAGAIAILIIGRMVSRWVAKTLLKVMTRAKMDETLSRFLSSMAQYAILAFTGIAVLSQFGIQTASLVAVLGAAGLAIGLALQGTLSHVASGVMILIFRPFKIGDYIEAGGTAGTVSDIGLFMTELNTPQNVHIVVPNGQLWDTTLSNYSKNTTRRVDIVMGIDYGDSIDKAMEIMEKVLKSDKRMLSTKGKELQMVVTNLGDSAVEITARAWVKTGDFWSFNFDNTKAIKEAFDKAGISIPFPQQVVHHINQK